MFKISNFTVLIVMSKNYLYYLILPIFISLLTQTNIYSEKNINIKPKKCNSQSHFMKFEIKNCSNTKHQSIFDLPIKQSKKIRLNFNTYLEKNKNLKDMTHPQSLFTNFDFSAHSFEILNGFGKPNQAKLTAKYFKENGFNVIKYGDSKKYSYKKTLLVNWHGNFEKTIALSKFLNLKKDQLVIYNMPDKKLHFSLVLGKDWPQIFKQLSQNKIQQQVQEKIFHNIPVTSPLNLQVKKNNHLNQSTQINDLSNKTYPKQKEIESKQEQKNQLNPLNFSKEYINQTSFEIGDKIYLSIPKPTGIKKVYFKIDDSNLIQLHYSKSNNMFILDNPIKIENKIGTGEKNIELLFIDEKNTIKNSKMNITIQKRERFSILNQLNFTKKGIIKFSIYTIVSITTIILILFFSLSLILNLFKVKRKKLIKYSS